MSIKGSRSRAGKEYYKNDSYWKSTSFHKKHSKERLFKEGVSITCKILNKVIKKGCLSQGEEVE